MKKFKIAALFMVVLLNLTACGSSADNKKAEGNENLQTIIVGATSVPHAEILKEIVSDLSEEGISLQIKEFSDYSLLNQALNDEQLDANFFQHLPYLEKYVTDSGQKLVSVGPVHTEPLGIYSLKIKSLDELKDKAKIGIANDPTNESRGLFLLEKQGLIKLKDNADLSKSTPKDIVENSKNFEFIELDAAQLPRNLGEFDIAVINTNYVLETDLNPLEDAIAMEDKDSPFANILAVKEGDENKESIQKVYKALTSEKVKKFIEDKYKGVIIPAF